MKKILTLSATAATVMIALTGCSTPTDHGTMTGMEHSSPGSSPAADSAASHNAADTMFAQMMIPHHAQAIEMSEIMLAKTGLDAKTTVLVRDIKAAQGPEIKKMESWLTAWDEPTTVSGSHAMSGMLSDEELEKLEAATGTEATRLFLTQMIAHHDGAVQMAADAVADGKNAEVIALARDIVSAQDAEIATMKDMLAAL